MKSKLFFSLSLLTAVFSMNIQGMDINAELQKARELAGATVNDPRIKGANPVHTFTTNIPFTEKMFLGYKPTMKVPGCVKNPFVQMGALCATTASAVAGSLYGLNQYQKNAEQNQFDINAELIKARNLEIAQKEQFEIEAELIKAHNLELSKQKGYRLAIVKAHLNNGLNFVKNQSLNGVNLAKTYKKTSAVAGAAVVAGLGYMGYKKLAAKYAQAKTPVVTTPVVKTPVVSTPVKKAVVKKAVKTSMCRRNRCNRRK